MDVQYFLKQRVGFIQQFYEISSAPYTERKRLIETEKEPFVPTYSEDHEPAFLDKWLEAEDSLQVLGRACVSMLSAVFKLYFKTWEHRTGIPVDSSLKADFDNGWFIGYKAYFARHFHICFDDSPARLAVLEEIILVRNRSQHPESITIDSSHYSNSDLKKITHPFFIDENYASLFSEAEDGEGAWLIAPQIQITKEKLFTALSEVVGFVEWLENVDVDNMLH